MRFRRQSVLFHFKHPDVLFLLYNFFRARLSIPDTLVINAVYPSLVTCKSRDAVLLTIERQGLNNISRMCVKNKSIFGSWAPSWRSAEVFHHSKRYTREYAFLFNFNGKFKHFVQNF